MNDNAKPPAARSALAGGCIVLLLAVVFFSLLALLFGYSRKDNKPSGPARAETLYVIPTRLRIRTAPNAKGPVMTSVLRGQQLKMLEDREAWVRVQAPDGTEGWTERTFLEGEAEHQRRLARIETIRKLPPLDGVVQKESPLYAGPGIFYPLVGDLAESTRVKVFTRDHDFFAIENEGGIAYIDIDDVDVTGSEASAKIDIAGVGTPEGTSTAPATTETQQAETSTLPEQEPAAPEPEPEAPPVERAAVYPFVPEGGTSPVIVDQVRPRYPVMARRRGTEGPVILRMIVRRDGSVDDVEVIRDLPDGLGDAAQDAVREWRFRPATLHGQPIDVYYTVTVRFRLTPGE